MIKKDTFDKEKFKKELESNVRMLFRRNLDEATTQQIYQAVAYSVKDDIIDNWIETHKAYEKQDKKMVYYMSMEFLMGRALGNNMINLLCYDEVRETLEELGLDMNLIEDQEGSVQKDASFFISVGAEGKPDAVFVISYGFTNNAVFCKELLTAGILCQSSNFLIVLFIEKEGDFLEEIAKQDFGQITKAFDLLELNLKGYYVVAGTTIHLIKE